MFLSTSPVWGTMRTVVLVLYLLICFYPRPPYGGRFYCKVTDRAMPMFLSTSPVWGTASPIGLVKVILHVSIHVPRMGDGIKIAYPKIVFMFLSTSPVWGTFTFTKSTNNRQMFLSTSPVWGTTRTMADKAALQDVSIHVPRMGDVTHLANKICHRSFYPRPPYGGRYST